jgi:putative DNA primase/helicase
MSAGNTVRAHCLSCDPDKRKSKSLETYANGTSFCFRCHHKSRPCSSCGETFEYRHPEHERCDACFANRERVSAPLIGRNTANEEALINTSNDAGFPDGRKLAAIWTRTQPLRGTLGQTYLEHRHCVVPATDGDLRFLPGNDRYPPSLVALVTDAMTAKPLTLHFTRLAADGRGKAGTDRDKLLLRGHPKKGGVIRLWSDSDVRYGLGIAEGIETALSAAHAYTPVWATVDAGNMAAFPVLDGIETLLIFADNDEAGLRAARACGSRWAAAGREARLVVPNHGDVNDAVAA